MKKLSVYVHTENKFALVPVDWLVIRYDNRCVSAKDRKRNQTMHHADLNFSDNHLLAITLMDKKGLVHSFFALARFL